MYYVIAAASPNEVQNDEEISSYIHQNVPLLQEPQRNNNPHSHSTIHLYQVSIAQQ